MHPNLWLVLYLFFLSDFSGGASAPLLPAAMPGDTHVHSHTQSLTQQSFKKYFNPISPSGLFLLNPGTDISILLYSREERNLHHRLSVILTLSVEDKDLLPSPLMVYNNTTGNICLTSRQALKWTDNLAASSVSWSQSLCLIQYSSHVCPWLTVTDKVLINRT